MLKVVIDSNVWVSALLVQGKPRQLLDRFEDGLFTLVYPKWLIDELRNVPSKPRLAARIQSENLHSLIQLIQDKGILVETEVVPSICRDPKDDVFLVCSAAAQADFLITGDNDLLCLGNYQETRIVTPAQFLEILS